MALACAQFYAFSQAPRSRTASVLHPISPSPPPAFKRLNFPLSRRRAALFLASSLLQFLPHSHFAKSKDKEVPQEEEERVVRIFQEASPAVVYIKDLELQARAGKEERELRKSSMEGKGDDALGDAKLEGTGSGFVWDKAGHIVTNYHVVAKLATDTSGLHRCRVGFLEDSNGRTFSREGKLVGFDPAYDLAVLKVDIERVKLRPAHIGTSHDLRVGQSCFAIGNPYGYEHTLTTGVVSGLRREIPSPNGRAIRGAIQTDAAINAAEEKRKTLMEYTEYSVEEELINPRIFSYLIAGYL